MLKILATVLCSMALLATTSNAIAEKDRQWLTDMYQAQKIAKAEGKDIFMFFTGSDWCGWCIKLGNEVLSKEGFLTYANDNLILVELDFPSNASIISKEQLAHNNKWLKKFPIEGYPTIVLTDASANRYAVTGYQHGGPIKYVEHLKILKANIRTLKSTMTQASKVSGLERAKLLDKALNLEGAVIKNTDELENEIFELSKTDNILNNKYLNIKGNKEIRAAINAKILPDTTAEEDLQALLIILNQHNYVKKGEALKMLIHMLGQRYRMTGKISEGSAFMGKISKDSTYPAEFRQMAGIMKAFMIAETGDMDTATIALDQALALAPESHTATKREKILQRMTASSPKTATRREK